MGVVVDAVKERTSAAKAADEDKAVMAAVNRCATQNQVQHQLFPQPVKPLQSEADVEPAPEGASDFRRTLASLKRCPDTKP